MRTNMAETKKQEYRVFIVDNHPVTRRGLTQFINRESDFMVCGDSGDIYQALKDIENSEPDITIVEISLGHSSGIRLIEDLSRYYPNLSILTFSMLDESIYAERCLKAGAKGYIMKHEPPEKVVSALRKILEGDIHVSDELSKELLYKFFNKKTEACSSPVEILGNRELEVFQLTGQGLKTRKIAEVFNLSKKTIENHIVNIKKKMDFKDSRELFVHAVKFVNNTGNMIF